MSESNGRQRLRPWLEAQISSSLIRGLEWIDEDNRIFKIPWKRSGTNEWSEEDSQIFKEWALHTGKFREGIDTPDWPCWKTRLRCALNKLPDIQELRSKSSLDGPDPYRVYQFKPKRSVHSSSANIGMKMRNEEDMEVSDVTTAHREVSQYQKLPVTVLNSLKSDEVHQQKNTSLGSDLNEIDVNDLFCQLRQESDDENQLVIEEQAAVSICKTLNDHTSQYFKEKEEREVTEPQVILKPQSIPEDVGVNPHGQLEKNDEKKPCQGEHEMDLMLRFRANKITEHHIMNKCGCHLYHGSSEYQYFDENITGPPGVEHIHFPLHKTVWNNKKQELLTLRVLNVMDRGLNLQCHEGDIFALRQCRCVVFVSSPNSDELITKIQRNGKWMKIFDFKNCFIPAFKNYWANQGPKPKAEVLIGFGQKWNPKDQSLANLIVSATVVCSRAEYLLKQASGCSFNTPSSLHISKDDDLDRYLDQLKHAQMM